MTPYARRVLDLVEQIPAGRVMSYGVVAAYVDSRSARSVGAVLARWGSEVPWHRVVRADGTPHGTGCEALSLLAAESVPLAADGRRVQMDAAAWTPGRRDA